MKLSSWMTTRSGCSFARLTGNHKCATRRWFGRSKFLEYLVHGLTLRGSPPFPSGPLPLRRTARPDKQEQILSLQLLKLPVSACTEEGLDRISIRLLQRLNWRELGHSS